MNFNINIIIKLILSILLFLCLADMPYAYFQFVRLVALVVFSILAYQSYEKGEQTALVLYIALAILFQPFEKIALGRMIWNIIDVVVAVGLLLSIVLIQKSKK
jgi:hypothetical protein